MAGRMKHMERSRYSYHNKPNFTRFHRKAAYKKASKARGSFVDSLFGVFKRQKKGDK